MQYTPLALPPQEQTTVFVCGRCSAVVVHRDVHDDACDDRPDWSPPEKAVGRYVAMPHPDGGEQ